MSDIKSLQQWENTAFSRIFRFTLQQTENPNQLFLSQFVSELEEANYEKPFLLSSSILDGALVSRLFLDLPPNTPTVFDYLYDSWASCNEIKKNMIVKAKNLDPQIVEQRVQSLNKTMELLVSYIGLSISYPDMYPNSEYNCPSFAHRMVLEPDDNRMIQEAFIVHLYNRFQDDELVNILDPLVNAINMALMKFTIADDFRTPLKALTILLQHKTIASHFPKLSSWMPASDLQSALQIESTIALGPPFRLSVLSDMLNPVASKFFFDNNGELVKDVQSTNSSLQLTFSRILDTLFELMNQIIRSSPESREATIKLLSNIIERNIKRDGIQVNPAEVSSDRFIVNLNLILLKFCQPFVDRFHNNIQKIDPDYFSKTNLIDLKDAVRINASKEQVEKFESQSNYSNNVNFISHIFHLTYRYFHYGYLTLCSKHRRLQREKEYLQEQVETLEQQAAAGNPNQQLMLKRSQMQLKSIKGTLLSIELILMDEGLTELCFMFFNLASTWLVRLVDPTSQHPQNRIKLPIQGQPSPQLCMLPEHYLGDISEFFLYQAKNNPKAFTLVSPQDLITFIITFLTHPDLIKNPHTKIQLIETLFYSVMNHYNPPESPIGSLLLGDQLALSHLLPALMRFYVDVEHTGLSSQFHDKFNVRYNIALLFKILWNHNEHRQRLSEQTKNMDFFVKFVNLLMNDTTHLLFEALSKLSEIHSIQTEMNNLDQWNSETQEHREQRLETLHSDERQAGSYVALSNENVTMLGYLTLENQKPFLSEEIVDRLAAMLNYTLSGLVGPKCTELKVNNPEKYQFNPKKLLGSLMDIYLNLQSERFIKAMANDQRSFKVALFDRAINILGKFGLKNSSYLDRLSKLVKRVETKVQELQLEDERLQDYPPEFEDPLMSTMMRNPVKLPSSGITIDLSTIKSHLLSDGTDPFNRQPLTIDMIIPDTELKDKIDAFINERLNQNQ